MADQKAVLYVDMLGFSALTEGNSVSADEFSLVDRPSKDDFLKVKFESLGNNKLIEHYTKFNMAVDAAVESALLCGTEPTVISFSDSAFIAADSVFDVIAIAKQLLIRLLKEGVPVRCAVAFGTFVVLRFRSDLSLRAGTHAAQFVGTGVVWSHAAAELSGIKGMRILLHHSAHALLSDPRHLAPVRELSHRTLSIPDGEDRERAGVVGEVNYLNSGMNNRDEELWREVQSMGQDAPERAQPHYAATLQSINRMRLALNREPLSHNQ